MDKGTAYRPEILRQIIERFGEPTPTRLISPEEWERRGGGPIKEPI